MILEVELLSVDWKGTYSLLLNLYISSFSLMFLWSEIQFCTVLHQA